MISQEDIKHVAHLARLELTVQEVNKYAQDLTAVVDYINQLKQVDTTNVEPTAQVTGLVNRLRQDQVKNWDQEEIAEALQQAKVEPGQEMMIKRVLN